MIRIGLDFDGVVVYDPVRVVRAPVKWFKKRVLGMRKLTYYVPHNRWQQMLWKIVFGAGIWPAKGVNELRELGKNSDIELYLITGRFKFLEKNINWWLKKNNLAHVFKSITINEHNEQPHLFKERTIKKLKLDYYVEDNLDVVQHLAERLDCKILWVYNMLDVTRNYPYKFPYLQKTIEWIRNDIN